MPSTYAYARTRWSFAIFRAHRVLILESRWGGDGGELCNAAQIRHFFVSAYVESTQWD
jgi:hypothetical protein